MASRDTNLCVPELQEKIPLIIKDYNFLYASLNLILKPICTLRSVAEQQEKFAQGRTAPGKIITNCDGIIKVGNHNPIPDQPLSRAVDFGVFQSGVYITSDIYYFYLGRLCMDYNLGWGGFWDGFKDRPHVEVKGS